MKIIKKSLYSYDIRIINFLLCSKMTKLNNFYSLQSSRMNE